MAYLEPCQTYKMVGPFYFKLLKLVYAIFYQIFIFSPNESPLKAMKNVLYFIQKALFILQIFKFL